MEKVLSSHFTSSSGGLFEPFYRNRTVFGHTLALGNHLADIILRLCTPVPQDYREAMRWFRMAADQHPAWFLVLDLENSSPRQIFGAPDDMKFRCSMTLFCARCFRGIPFPAGSRLLVRWPNKGTLQLLGSFYSA